MGPAGRQFQALLWKNWLCRLRHPVLSLAEFFWPCILFMILTVLRFQEPPRHRDTCYLQPRDLPSRGVFPFVQSLLCNTGSRCSNVSYLESMEHHFRSTRFQTTNGHQKKVNELIFLKEIQDLAEGIYEIIDKAQHLQHLWAEKSKTPDSPGGSNFLMTDLNKTEEVILTLENLHQQPHIWNFLHSLPRLLENKTHVEDGIGVGVHLLQAVQNSLTSIKDLDWLPLNHTFARVSEIVLNVTISTLTFLQEHGVAAAKDSGYILSLYNVVWDPQKVQADLTSEFGFDNLHAKQILNYSTKLQEIPTDSSLEQLVCSVLSRVSEEEVDRDGQMHECQSRRPEVQSYLLHSVSWWQVYRQVYHQWQKSVMSVMQTVLTGIGHSLEVQRNQYEEKSQPWKVVDILPTGLLLLNDSLASEGPESNHTSAEILLHLQKLQSALQNLPEWPMLKRVLQLGGALRNMIAQHLHLLQEAFIPLEDSVKDPRPSGPEQMKLSKEEFFEALKQLLMKNPDDVCPNGLRSERKVFLNPENSTEWEDLWRILCQHNFSSILTSRLDSVNDAHRRLQEIIIEHTNWTVSISEEYMGWKDLQTQLLEVSLSCSQLYGLLGADILVGDSVFSGECGDLLASTVIFHMFRRAQSSLERTRYWNAFTGFIRKMCEVAQYTSMQSNFSQSPFDFPEGSPCYERTIDWKFISDTYLAVLHNLLKSPGETILRILNSTKELLVMENNMYNLEDDQRNFLLSFVDFWEKLLQPNPLNSSSLPKFPTLPSLMGTLLNTSHLWIYDLKSLEKDPYAPDTQKLLEFGEEMIRKIQTLGSLWLRTESKNILRFLELMLFEINPKLLELWMYGISERERAKLETLSSLLNLSVPENERTLSQSFNFSQLFHSDLPNPPSVKLDFVHISETVINSLYESGLLKQGQVSEAVDTVYAIRNASHIFSTLSQAQKEEVEKILTHIYLNVFKDKDAALLLQIYSSFYQHIYRLLSFPDRQPLLSFLAQLSKHILNIIKQFNFQSISKAFAFLHETAGLLGGISEASYCQQLLSMFNFLEHQAQSLMSTERPELKVIHATLTGLKQLLQVDRDFRASLFQYVRQLFSGSEDSQLTRECFSVDSENVSVADYPRNEASSLILPWAQILSNLSTDENVFNEFIAIHCTASWLQMWMDIWGNTSQIFKLDMDIFTPLRAGFMQLLDELESVRKIPKICQGMFPTHQPARLLLSLFENVTQAGRFFNWHDFLILRDLWVALDDVFATVNSLHWDQVEKSLFSLETSLNQLKALPLNPNISREFFYPLLGIFIELSNNSDYFDRYAHLINHPHSTNFTDYGVLFQNVLTELRGTVLFLRNVSHNQDILFCMGIFQNVTEFILEDGLLDVNMSQRTLYILTMLNFTFSSEETLSRLKRCSAWVDTINHLYVMYNSSFSQDHPQGILRSFRDVEKQINSTLKIATWMINIKESQCVLNMSIVDCVNIYLGNISDFLNVILSEVFKKETVPKFEILLTLLNDSTSQVRMIINNLAKDFDHATQSNWRHFMELILRSTETSEKIPSQFKDIWLHSLALGKEIQKLVKDITFNILENNTSLKTDKFLNVFTTILKAKDINRLGDSFYHLASFLAFNLTYDFQNSSQMIPNEVMKALSLSILLARDVFSSLMPSVHQNIPQNSDSAHMLKKVASFLHSFKKTDVDLLVDQLEQISGSLMNFFKNISRSSSGSVGVNLLVDLMEKLVDSSHSWNMNHLLKLSRLFPKRDVDTVLDTYYLLPHTMRLLQRILDKNITEVLGEVYNFTLLHGISILNVTKEDFAAIVKALLGTVELITDQPGIFPEALTCLPIAWCWNHTTLRFHQDPKLETCNVKEFMSSSLYSQVATIFDHLHLSPPGDEAQCSNESSQMEITRKMVCVLHELVDWNSILLKMSDVFHIRNSFFKTTQEFWHTVLPFVESFDNQSNGHISEFCPTEFIKPMVFQIIEKLKNVNFTEVASGENILNTLRNLDKVFNITEISGASVPKGISLNLERIITFFSRDLNVENNTHASVSPFMMTLNGSLTGGSLETQSNFIKNEASYMFGEIWLKLQQTMKDLWGNLSIFQLSEETEMMNSTNLQNITLQLDHFLEVRNSSSLKALEMIADFLLATKNWLHQSSNEDHSRIIQTLFLLNTSENSIGEVVWLIKDITTIVDYLKNISTESTLAGTLLSHLLNPEKFTNFSVIQLLFESLLINSINNLPGSSQEATLIVNDTGLQLMHFLNRTLNLTQSENGERIILPRNIMEQILKVFSSLLNEESVKKLSLLPKVFHKAFAEMRFPLKGKILEILKQDQFLTSMKEDRLIDTFLSLKKIVKHLIKSSFLLGNDYLKFDTNQGPKFIQDLFNILLMETSMKNITENNLEFLMVTNHLFSQMNGSEGLVTLNQNLRSALDLVKDITVELENLMSSLLNSPNKDFYALYPKLQEIILANLTDLLSIINNSFPLQDKATLEITKRFLGIISGVAGDRDVLKPLLEMSHTLVMLVSDSAEARQLAMLVKDTVELLQLAHRVSTEVTRTAQTHSISSTDDNAEFFDALYSTLHLSLRHAVNTTAALRKGDPLLLENMDALLIPFLDLAFQMVGVKANISRDSGVLSNTFSYVNQSKESSGIFKEVAEFFTSVNMNVNTVERFLVALNNGNQLFSMGSVNLWEEILDCLISINNITNQIDLFSNRFAVDSVPQNIKWEKSQEVLLVLDEMLSQNNTEIGSFLRTVVNFTLEGLWDDLEKTAWDLFNLFLLLAEHPDHLLETITAIAEVSSGNGSAYAGDLSKALFINTSLIPNPTLQQLEEAVQTVLSQAAFLKTELLVNNSQWINSMRTLLQSLFDNLINATTGEKITSVKEERIKKDKNDISDIFKPLSCFQKHLKELIELVEYWQKLPLTDPSVAAMCQIFQQPLKPPGVLATLQKVQVLVLRMLIVFAENPDWVKDVLCAALSCHQGGIRPLMLSALQGVTLVSDHYQEMEKLWSSPQQLNCAGLSRNLFSILDSFKVKLENASNKGCECQLSLDKTQLPLQRLAQSLGKALLSGNPVMASLSNFTVTEDVKVKDLVKNITKLKEDLHSSTHISEETINSILEANVSHSKVLVSVLTVAVSGRCDQNTLHLLLKFPEDETSWFATNELCSLPASQVYALVVCLSQNLDLRSVIYKMLIPSEASGLLSSLLDLVSRLSQLLSKASHVLEYLPDFLQDFQITTLLDMPTLQQAPRDGQSRSSAFGSFQSVMKMVCKDQASFLSNSNTFIDLPRVNELLEDDKDKFNIPEDSTPFCLKLYQEILQFPNGALVWSFLKPVLHGKILYTPNTPEINKIIQKANYTFNFVDTLKSLSETLLKISSVFQSHGNDQMLSQLQEVLKTKFIRNYIESQILIDVDKLTEKLQSYGGMLYKMFNQTGSGHIQFLGHILVNLSSCVVLNRFQAVESVALLESKAQELMQQNDFLASIIFSNVFASENLTSDSFQLPRHINYTIRTSVLYSMRTDLVKNPFWKFHPQSLPAEGFKYNYIFVPLQDMLERAVILVQTGQETMEPATQAQAIPYPCHTSDLFLNNVGFFFPLIMMLTWMVSVASMVRKLVYEREIQIEEYMKMMGVHPTIHFLAWFLENMAALTLSSAALAIILKASGIFAHSNALIIFLFFLNFGVSIVMLSYFLSAFFHQANTAALCTSLVYMISFLPYIILLVLHNQISAIVQTFLCLLSTTAFGQGVFFVTFLEGQEAGIQWNNMYQAPEQLGMTFGWVCWMILFDSGLYFLCGWYLSNLAPGTFGLRKPWYFPFTMSYWKNVCGLMEKRTHVLRSDMLFFNENVGNKASSLQKGTEKVEEGPPGVVLVSVTKKYEHHMAVQDLTLTFHRDQITALLGTNGAGKTTVISMLTGLYPPTSGTIIINGRNLQTDLPRIRMELGVCPQRDVLFDNLTVLEHLLIFASIKAPQWTPKELQKQVNKTLQDVGLMQHQHKQTCMLSGGMKRKLSIGIAFIGRTRTVVLDEPTSGVDPCSRRNIWDILLKYREGRTVIFTTHHLDEAEALSDRVAVLQRGQLRCCGPPLGLTEAHGRGLSLTLTRQTSGLEIQDLKDLARATTLIQTYIPQAFLKGSSHQELSYAIPKDADRTGFKGLFQALEQNLQHLHLTGYGLADTTLEEVFLMLLQDPPKQPDIAPEEPELEADSHRPAARTPDVCDGAERPPTMQGTGLLRAQVSALLMKRFLRTRRAWKGTLSHLLLPVLFVALAMGLFMVKPLAIHYPPLRLTPGHYDRAETYFFSSERQDLNLTNMLLRNFGAQNLLCGDINSDPENSSCWHRDPVSHPDVQDSCGCLKCLNGSFGAPYLTNHLGHTLLNMSALPLEEYLLVPSEKPRLGGWSFGVRIPNQVQDADSNISKAKTVAKVWYNQKGFHSLPSYLNHLNNLILWQALPPDVDWKQYGITLYSHPYGGALLNEDKVLESIRQCGVALCIVLGFSILSASIGSSVVRDRVTGAKRLQHISGLGYRTYWLTNFFYDMLFYLVSVCLCVAIIMAFQLTAFTFRENLAATALLLALFGYATLPWMYLMSRIFSSSDVAFISYISVNFIFGLCTMLMTIMPRLLAIISKAQNLQNIYDILKWVFTIFPQFCLGQGLIELCYNQIKYDLTHNFGIDSYVSPFEMDFLGWIFVQLASQGTILLILRILLHWDLLQRPRSQSSLQGTVTASKDIDVEKEQMRVLKGRTDGDILVLCNLSKSYRGFFKRTNAVQDISLGIPRGECFGLLGANGAGKTTTFKMLNGDIPPTSGHVIIRTPMGRDVDPSLACDSGIRIGYCPQQDALDELLTGWEHLHYYCILRGIPQPCIAEVAGDLVRRLHLETHVDKLVATYSGGTKRKLSTALALLGKPDLILLDEPSSGMDPCSKRYLWKTITREVQEGCAAVLTSHSMEECEALCTRLAIMMDGSFRCLGSPQHIKDREELGDGTWADEYVRLTKSASVDRNYRIIVQVALMRFNEEFGEPWRWFGDGYTVRIWLSKETNQHSAVTECLKLHFTGIQFKGQHLNLLEYHVPKRWECLADLFKVLENNKTTLNIKYYSINQTTLEQVFVNFATEQQQAPPSASDPSTDSYRPYHLSV